MILCWFLLLNEPKKLACAWLLVRDNFNILQQFLIEAVLICLIGGVTGILLSGLIGLLFNVFMTDFTMAFSTGSIVAAVVFSTLIGVIFGYMPAKRAAQLDPITALARE